MTTSTGTRSLDGEKFKKTKVLCDVCWQKGHFGRKSPRATRSFFPTCRTKCDQCGEEFGPNVSCLEEQEAAGPRPHIPDITPVLANLPERKINHNPAPEGAVIDFRGRINVWL